jgi:hypothetical protein
MSHTITILHTEGCLRGPEAEKVARSLATSRHDIKVEVVLIEDEAQAVPLGFRGSPTVLIDGVDIEPDSEIPLGVGQSASPKGVRTPLRRLERAGVDDRPRSVHPLSASAGPWGGANGPFGVAFGQVGGRRRAGQAEMPPPDRPVRLSIARWRRFRPGGVPWGPGPPRSFLKSIGHPQLLARRGRRQPRNRVGSRPRPRPRATWERHRAST